MIDVYLDWMLGGLDEREQWGVVGFLLVCLIVCAGVVLDWVL